MITEIFYQKPLTSGCFLMLFLSQKKSLTGMALCIYTTLKKEFIFLIITEVLKVNFPFLTGQIWKYLEKQFMDSIALICINMLRHFLISPHFLCLLNCKTAPL